MDITGCLLHKNEGSGDCVMHCATGYHRYSNE